MTTPTPTPPTPPAPTTPQPPRRTLTRTDLIRPRPAHPTPIHLPELGGVVFTRQLGDHALDLVGRGGLTSQDGRVRTVCYGQVLIDGLCDERGFPILHRDDEDDLICGPLPIESIGELAVEVVARSIAAYKNR